MKKITIILMIISVLSQITGFLRELTLSYFYGASNISDAYLISITIPMVIFSFIGRSLTTSFIPVYANMEHEKGENSAIKFTQNLINHLFIILTFIVIISYFFTPQIVGLFASGFDEQTTLRAITFSRITIIGIYAMVMVNIYSSILQYHDKFVFPALTGVVMNMIVIISIYFSWKYDNLLILSIGTLISMIAQALVLYPKSRSIGIKFQFFLDIKDENIKKLIYLSIPVIAGVAVNEINVLVDRTIASGISVGGISALNYANKLNGFIYGIFVFSISTVLYPTIIKKINQKDTDGFLKLFRESIVGVILLVIPATVGLMVLSNPIISLLYGRGAFGQDAISLTSSALFFYSFGIVGVSLRQIISRVYYALQDTKTPMLNASIGLILNIILNIILSKYLGIGGLALATSISAILTTSLLFFSLRKKLGPIGMKHISVSFLKVLFASIIMGIFSKLTFNQFKTSISENYALLCAMLIGVISYIIIIYFMKIGDVDVIVKMLKDKIRKVLN